MKSGFGKGFLILTLSGLVCKIIGAFFRLPLTYILGTEGLGVFQLVMSVFSFALILTSGGVSVTISKMIASSRAKGKYGDIKWFVYLGLVYCVALSFVFGVIFLFLSKQISLLQQVESAGLSYRFFFPLLLFSSLVALFRGVYQGYEDMSPTAVSQIIEQLCKFVFGLLFAFYLAKTSLALGVLGAFLGILSGEVLAFVYLMFAKRRFKFSKYKINIGRRGEFFSYLVPSTLGLTISPFVHFFDSIVTIGFLTSAGFASEYATSLFGLQTGVVGSILNFPVIISVSLATALLPSLSFKKTKEENEKELQESFSLLWWTILPVTLGILGVSLPLYQVVYPFFSASMISYAVKLTALGALSTIAVGFMQYLTSILQANGDFKFVMIALIFGGIGKILCTIFLCPIRQINIFGIAIGNVVFSAIVVVFCLLKLRKFHFLTMDSFFSPLLSSLVMLVVVSALVAILQISPILKLLICLVVGVVIYLGLTFPMLFRFKRDFLGKKKTRGKDEQEGSDRNNFKQNSLSQKQSEKSV